jgi:formate dehydrogenase major subunit
MDGRQITVEGPTTLLEAARANGIAIPSLCDHPGLAPYAA